MLTLCDGRDPMKLASHHTVGCIFRNLYYVRGSALESCAHSNCHSQITVKGRPCCFVSCHGDFVQQPIIESLLPCQNLLIGIYVVHKYFHLLLRGPSIHFSRFPRTDFPILLNLNLSKLCQLLPTVYEAM